MVAPLQDQLQEYRYTGAFTLEENITAVITYSRQDDR